ncbi:MAG: dehydrogenase [Chloroflexi bacterium]|jgi:threonine dehydrogenase-like Zn-dependent dehydrogenase|nr:dehydrogenase [Chloroflexota bacterium]
MKATLIYGPHDIRFENVPDPQIKLPTDAIVRVVASCVCGSDLWPYRGVTPTSEPHPIGHEFVGVVEEVGSEVSKVKRGDFVIAPFAISDGTCAHCRNGITTSCAHGGWWGSSGADGFPTDGGQAEALRVPLADGTLFPLTGQADAALIPSLLTLSDVMGTGHHVALSARVKQGDRVVVVGDGAVGLCAVLAAKRLGANQIIAMSRHPQRQALARDFGATDIITERGEEGAERVRELTRGVGADAVLECVGTKESMQQAFDAARPGGRVGFVGVPHGGPEAPISQMFYSNIGLAGGAAPARVYMPDLLPDVLEGRIEPGRVFDLELPLSQVADAYSAMDERRAIKVLLRP